MRVAEDFSPFDINVTTKDPGRDAIDREESEKDGYGVVATVVPKKGSLKEDKEWGFTYTWTLYRNETLMYPAVVFHAPGKSARYTANHISHEVGHLLGLSHDGLGRKEYYGGEKSGNMSWAPIMGSSNNIEFAQWSKGEYNKATNKQDDYSVFEFSGVPFEKDDHGNSIGEATTLAAQQTNSGFKHFSATGVIHGPNDKDFFKLNVGAGALTINVKPAPVGPNVDLGAILHDSTGKQVAYAAPQNELSAEINFNVPLEGEYFVEVFGTGNEGQISYTNYGSIGQFTVNIQGQLNSEVNNDTNNDDAAFNYNETIEATAFTSESDPTNDSMVRKAGKVVGWIKNGTFIKFENLGINRNNKVIQEVEVTYSSKGAGGHIEFVLQQPGSPISLGQFKLNSTGGWDKFVTQNFAVNVPATEFDKLTDSSVPLQINFINKNTNKYLYNINSFKLSTGKVTNDDVTNDVATNDADADNAAFNYNQSIEATAFTSESNPTNNSMVRKAGKVVGWIKNGTFIKFENLGINRNNKVIQEVEVTYSSKGAGGHIEFVLQQPGSPISLGQFKLNPTGGWDKFVTQNFAVNVPITEFDKLTDSSVPLQVNFINNNTGKYLYNIQSFKLSN